MDSLAVKNSQCLGAHGMVSTGHFLASLAAIDALKSGGNAFDAALAASAVLNVVLPMSCGFGGDLVLCGWIAHDESPISFLALGRTPKRLTCSTFEDRGCKRIPVIGPLSSTIPAAFDAYPAIHARFCTLPLCDVLGPAVTYASGGFVVSPQFSRWVSNNLAVIQEDANLRSQFAPDGVALSPGSILVQHELADTINEICHFPDNPDKRRAFIESFVESNNRAGGVFSTEDFSTPVCCEVRPLELRVGNAAVFTSPLPTQGYLLLQSLAMLGHIGTNRLTDETTRIHIMCEILNQIFAQRLAYATDPEWRDNTEMLLGEKNIARMRGAIDFEAKTPCLYSEYYLTGDTTHLCVVDRERNAASITQSLGLGFGAGVQCAKTGIIFNNRLGRSCTLRPDDLNMCRPGFRPINTIFNFVVAEGKRLRLVGGTPGGDGQVQWNLQVLERYLLNHSPLEDAISSKKWTYYPGCDLHEKDYEHNLVLNSSVSNSEALTDLGYVIKKKRDVGGCVRLIENRGSYLVGIDDREQEGITLGF